MSNQRTFTVVIGSKSFVVCNPVTAELLKLANEAHIIGAKAVKKELMLLAIKVESGAMTLDSAEVATATSLVAMLLAA